MNALVRAIARSGRPASGRSVRAGRALLPLACTTTNRPHATDERPNILFILYRYWTHHRIRPAHMGVRDHRYKLIFFYGDRLDTTGSEDAPTTPAWELYDLAADPREDRNCYGDPSYAAVAARLKRELLDLRREVGDQDPAGNGFLRATGVVTDE